MEEEERLYNMYLGLAESWGFKPLPYEEWLKKEKEEEE